MTHSPTPRPSFGRALGQTARQIAKLHRRALADYDTDFPTWMLFTLLKDKGVPLPADEVVRDLHLRADVAEPDAIRVIERAAVAGTIAYEPDSPPSHVTLTEAGAALFANLYAHARKATDIASDGIDPVMLDTAVTVLLAAEERATAQLDQSRIA